MRTQLVRVSVVLLGIAVAGCMDQPVSHSTSEPNTSETAALETTCAGVQLCCSDVTTVTSPLQALLASVGLTVPLDELVGLTCSTVGDCTKTSVCCTTDATTILTGTVGLDCTLD